MLPQQILLSQPHYAIYALHEADTFFTQRYAVVVDGDVDPAPTFFSATLLRPLRHHYAFLYLLCVRTYCRHVSEH